MVLVFNVSCKNIPPEKWHSFFKTARYLRVHHRSNLQLLEKEGRRVKVGLELTMREIIGKCGFY